MSFLMYSSMLSSWFLFFMVTWLSVSFTKITSGSASPLDSITVSFWPYSLDWVSIISISTSGFFSINALATASNCGDAALSHTEQVSFTFSPLALASVVSSAFASVSAAFVSAFVSAAVVEPLFPEPPQAAKDAAIIAASESAVICLNFLIKHFPPVLDLFSDVSTIPKPPAAINGAKYVFL